MPRYRRLCLHLIGLLLLTCTTSALKCRERSATPGREVVCYTSRSEAARLENAVCDCTTLVHQGHDLRSLDASELKKLRDSAKQANPSVRMIFSLTDSQGILKSSATTRQEAAAHLIEVLKEVDGVELNVTAGGKEKLVTFVKGLKEELANKSLDRMIFLALPTKPEDLAKQFELKELSKYVDLFTVATHYLRDNDESYRSFHPSRLMGLFDMLNTDSLVDLISGMGAPKQKILISAPASAYTFTLKKAADNTPRSSTVEEQPTMIDRKKLCDAMNKDEWTVERDEDLTAPYAFKNTTWIAFEDETSLKIKAKYVILRELAGLALRDVENDMKNDCGASLAKTISREFTEMKRKSREVVLSSLEKDLKGTEIAYPRHVRSSDFRIVRIVDTQGKIRAVRENTQTAFTCARQGYFVHPKSCNRFYRCVKFNQDVDDYSVFEFDCPAGLAFDERTEVCVWPGSISEGSACPGSSEIEPVPRGRFKCPSQPGFYADPQNCRWFFACYDLGGPEMVPYEFRCPFGLVFDEHRLLCEWPWKVPNCNDHGHGDGHSIYHFGGNYGGQAAHIPQGGIVGQGGFIGHGGFGGQDYENFNAYDKQGGHGFAAGSDYDGKFDQNYHGAGGAGSGADYDGQTFSQAGAGYDGQTYISPGAGAGYDGQVYNAAGTAGSGSAYDGQSYNVAGSGADYDGQTYNTDGSAGGQTFNAGGTANAGAGVDYDSQNFNSGSVSGSAAGQDGQTSNAAGASGAGGAQGGQNFNTGTNVDYDSQSFNSGSVSGSAAGYDGQAYNGAGASGAGTVGVTQEGQNFNTETGVDYDSQNFNSGSVSTSAAGYDGQTYNAAGASGAGATQGGQNFNTGTSVDYDSQNFNSGSVSTSAAGYDGQTYNGAGASGAGAAGTQGGQNFNTGTDVDYDGQNFNSNSASGSAGSDGQTYNAAGVTGSGAGYNGQTYNSAGAGFDGQTFNSGATAVSSANANTQNFNSAGVTASGVNYNTGPVGATGGYNGQDGQTYNAAGGSDSSADYDGQKYENPQLDYNDQNYNNNGATAGVNLGANDFNNQNVNIGGSDKGIVTNAADYDDNRGTTSGVFSGQSTAYNNQGKVQTTQFNSAGSVFNNDVNTDYTSGLNGGSRDVTSAYAGSTAGATAGVDNFAQGVGSTNGVTSQNTLITAGSAGTNYGSNIQTGNTDYNAFTASGQSNLFKEENDKATAGIKESTSNIGLSTISYGNTADGQSSTGLYGLENSQNSGNFRGNVYNSTYNAAAGYPTSTIIPFVQQENTFNPSDNGAVPPVNSIIYQLQTALGLSSSEIFGNEYKNQAEKSFATLGQTQAGFVSNGRTQSTNNFKPTTNIYDYSKVNLAGVTPSITLIRDGVYNTGGSTVAPSNFNTADGITNSYGKSYGESSITSGNNDLTNFQESTNSIINTGSTSGVLYKEGENQNFYGTSTPSSVSQSAGPQPFNGQSTPVPAVVPLNNNAGPSVELDNSGLFGSNVAGSTQTSGYKTNEYYDNGGRGTIRYNNGITTSKVTDNDIQDYRTPSYTGIPNSFIINSGNGENPQSTIQKFEGTEQSGQGLFTKEGFTKTGPTKTGITTAQVGGSGSYVIGTSSPRPRPNPQFIGETAFAGTFDSTQNSNSGASGSTVNFGAKPNPQLAGGNFAASGDTSNLGKAQTTINFDNTINTANFGSRPNPQLAGGNFGATGDVSSFANAQTTVNFDAAGNTANFGARPNPQLAGGNFGTPGSPNFGAAGNTANFGGKPNPQLAGGNFGITEGVTSFANTQTNTNFDAAGNTANFGARPNPQLIGGNFGTTGGPANFGTRPNPQLAGGNFGVTSDVTSFANAQSTANFDSAGNTANFGARPNPQLIGENGGSTGSTVNFGATGSTVNLGTKSNPQFAGGNFGTVGATSGVTNFGTTNEAQGYSYPKPLVQLEIKSQSTTPSAVGNDYSTPTTLSSLSTIQSFENENSVIIKSNDENAKGFSSTLSPIGYTTDQLENFKTTLFQATNLPQRVTTVRPVINTGSRTVISSTPIPAIVTPERQSYQTDNLSTTPRTFLAVGVNFNEENDYSSNVQSSSDISDYSDVTTNFDQGNFGQKIPGQTKFTNTNYKQTTAGVEENLNSQAITSTQEDYNNYYTETGFSSTGQTGFTRNNQASKLASEVTLPKQVYIPSSTFAPVVGVTFRKPITSESSQGQFSGSSASTISQNSNTLDFRGSANRILNNQGSFGIISQGEGNRVLNNPASAGVRVSSNNAFSNQASANFASQNSNGIFDNRPSVNFTPREPANRILTNQATANSFVQQNQGSISQTRTLIGSNVITSINADELNNNLRQSSANQNDLRIIAEFNKAGVINDGKVQLSTTPAPEITTYAGDYSKARTRVTSSSSAFNSQSQSRKVIVKLSDLHPLILGKLGAECTCKADPFAIFRGPSRQPLPINSQNRGPVDLSNYDESEIYVDVDNDRDKNRELDLIRNTPSNRLVKTNSESYDDDDSSIVVTSRGEPTSSTYLPPTTGRLSSTTYLPPSSSYLPSTTIRPSTTYLPPVTPANGYLPSSTEDPYLGDSESSLNAQTQERQPLLIRVEDDYQRRAAGRGRSGKSLADGPIGSPNDVRDRGASFDRYGPGGLRSDDETLQGSLDCARAGLFRHPKFCNKFYACHWDDWKKRFTLHVFNCPVHLAFDSSAGACNYPTKGPACQDNKLLV